MLIDISNIPLPFQLLFWALLVPASWPFFCISVPVLFLLIYQSQSTHYSFPSQFKALLPNVFSSIPQSILFLSCGFLWDFWFSVPIGQISPKISYASPIMSFLLVLSVHITSQLCKHSLSLPYGMMLDGCSL